MPTYLFLPASSKKIKYGSRTSRFHGFSLIEIMVALTISLLLLMGIVYVYTGSKQTYRGVAAISSMQENGRLAIEYLTQDLQMAGNLGCATRIITGMDSKYGECSDTATKDAAYYKEKFYNTLTSTTTFANNFRNTITGYDGEEDVDNATPGTSISDFSPALTGGPTTALANSDVVVVRGARPLGKTVIAQETGTAAVTAPSATGLAVNDVAIVASCQAAAVFTVTTVTTASPFKISHATGAKNACVLLDADNTTYIGHEILKAFSNVYFIALDTTNNLRSLYRQDISGTTQALVPGIENMQIKYGLASNIEGYPTEYYTAAEVTDSTPHNCYNAKDNTTLTSTSNNPWDCVKSVRVELLLVSAEDKLTTDTQKIWFNGSDFTPTDQRLRMVMTATIGVRNRLLQSQD